MKQIANESDISKKSTIIALFWIVLIIAFLVFRNNSVIKLYEPANYILVIVLAGSFLRKFIYKMVHVPSELFKDDTFLSFFDVSDLLSVIKNFTLKILHIRVKYRNMLVFAVIETFVIAFFIFIYSGRYNDAPYTLGAFLIISYLYYIYLFVRSLKIGSKKLIYTCLFIVCLLVLPVLHYFVGIVSILYFMLVLISFIGFLIMLTTDKDYIYALGLIFVCLIPIVLFFEVRAAADFIGICAFLTLCASVISDYSRGFVFEV